MDYLGNIFGYVLEFFYNIVDNYAIAIFLFTIFTRILMFPLTISQQKSSARMAKIQPKQKALQEKYANNRQKYEEELSKLYQKEGVNMTAGCLPMLIQLPIFYGLFVAIRKPISLMLLHIPNSNLILDLAKNLGVDTKNAYYEINMIGKLQGCSASVFEGLGFSDAQIDKIMGVVNGSGFSLFGADLLEIPKFFGNVAFIFTVLVVVTQFVSMYLSQKISGASMQQAGGCNPMVMSVFMSLFVGSISMGIPCAMAFYWICSSLIAPLQSYIVHKYYNAASLSAKSDARHMVTIKEQELAIADAVNEEKGKREFLPDYNYVQEQKENKKGKKK